MGRNKDQKARRKNAPGVKRELQREQAAASDENPPTGEAPGLDKDCPTCGVIAGYACETPSGVKSKKTHVARLK